MSDEREPEAHLLLCACCLDVLGASVMVLTLWVEFGVEVEVSLGQNEMSGCGEEPPLAAGWMSGVTTTAWRRDRRGHSEPQTGRLNY